MSRVGISKQRIIHAAKELVAKGELPTAIKVRNLLHTGSIVTIQKYLKEWKNNCSKVNENLVEDLSHTSKDLSEEIKILKQWLKQQISKNENYAEELIQAEKNIVDLRAENYELQVSNQELQISLTEAKATNSALEQLIEKIEIKLNLNTNETIEKMQQTIDDLRLELKTLNETSINALRDTSNNGHEALMQERVVSINLQAKVDSLNKELNQSHKQLELEQHKWQTQLFILQKQIKLQQKIIQTHISQEKLQQLDKELNLNFTKEVTVYGK